MENFEKTTFIKRDNVDGEWLSPVPSEREWQEQKLVEIFYHYPNACPKWQYLNGLIQIALQYIELTKDEDEECCPNCGECENIHTNYDWTKIDRPIEEFLCNECGSYFKPKE